MKRIVFMRKRDLALVGIHFGWTIPLDLYKQGYVSEEDVKNGRFGSPNDTIEKTAERLNRIGYACVILNTPGSEV